MSSSKKPVSRIGGVSESAGDPILTDLFAHIMAKRGHILNIHQVVAHSPKMLRAQAAYAAAMREDAIVPRDLQELLILRVAQVNGSEYEQRSIGRSPSPAARPPPRSKRLAVGAPRPCSTRRNAQPSPSSSKPERRRGR